jgi:hypothetical protein
MADEQSSRRDVLKKAVYIAPTILTLQVLPSFASKVQAEQAREKDKVKGNNGVGNGIEPQPPAKPPVNDGPGTGPGNPEKLKLISCGYTQLSGLSREVNPAQP